MVRYNVNSGRTAEIAASEGADAAARAAAQSVGTLNPLQACESTNGIDGIALQSISDDEGDTCDSALRTIRIGGSIANSPYAL